MYLVQILPICTFHIYSCTGWSSLIDITELLNICPREIKIGFKLNYFCFQYFVSKAIFYYCWYHKMCLIYGLLNRFLTSEHSTHVSSLKGWNGVHGTTQLSFVHSQQWATSALTGISTHSNTWVCRQVPGMCPCKITIRIVFVGSEFHLATQRPVTSYWHFFCITTI